MKSRAMHVLTYLLVLLLSVPTVFAPKTALAQSLPTFSQEELDQMLAPIALYPDDVLSQVLMAATYPIEVVEAARWTRANPSLKGEEAVAAVEGQNWDESVKSLVAFPQILQMMEEKLDWTERLGDAFLGQQAQVMDTVQYLRQKAMAAGNLQSNEDVRVEEQDQSIMIEPTNPDVLYVPYYDPTVVYGSWWWPGYPPVYWSPWPGYSTMGGIWWGPGISLGATFFFGVFDWPHHRIGTIERRRHRPPEGGGKRPIQGGMTLWQHNPSHRLGVPYRENILRQQAEPAVAPTERWEFRGHESIQGVQRRAPAAAPAAPAAAPAAPAGATAATSVLPQPSREFRGGARVPSEQRRAPSAVTTAPAAGSGGAVRAGPPEIRHFERRAPSAGSATTSPISRPAAESRPHVFEGVGRGAEVRDFSRRGQSSVPRAPEPARIQPTVTPQRVAPAPQPSGGMHPSGGRGPRGQEK